MTALDKLKKAETLSDLAALLGYKTQTLSYILYKIPPAKKYRSFEVPKRNGGTRTISAPCPQLKLLQRHLATLLYICRDHIDQTSQRRVLSHGFRRRHSIFTNAKPHKRRRYVLNLDIQDFFPSLNFGRVRGFFIKNRDFALNEKIATIIAQIACHENMLPQGSPCSPVIADLIAHPMDVRLAQLARKHGVTYTRYADDLTFSTGQKQFPSPLAVYSGQGHEWAVGSELAGVIKAAGFAVNSDKTRLQSRNGRQVVTGLTVNAKVNIQATYYRRARAMCHLLFKSGSYRVSPSAGNDNSSTAIESLGPLGGILAHIHFVKDAADHRKSLDKIKQPIAARKLYAAFIFYRLFVRLDRPLIVCEGKTDNVYLRYAIRALSASHPLLGNLVGKQFRLAVSLFNYHGLAHKILQVNGGTGDLGHFMVQYPDALRRYAHRPLAHPVIIIIDNDDGASKLFSIVKEKYKISTISINSTDAFYHLAHNLYLIKTPEPGQNKKSCIEHLFDPALLATTLDGKRFNPENDLCSEAQYGKHVFAEKVVRPGAASINFGGFAPLLNRIEAVLKHYKPPAAAGG